MFLNSDVDRLFFLNKNGLREVVDPPQEVASEYRFAWWREALREQAEINGREIVGEDLYNRAFRCNHPANLNGEILRYTEGKLEIALDAAVSDMESFDYGGRPLTGCIIPGSCSDLRHAFSDIATWSFLNSQKILREWLEPLATRNQALLRERWSQIKEISETITEDAQVHIPGGHLFFVGELGARKAAESIQLISEIIRNAKARLDDLCVQPDAR